MRVLNEKQKKILDRLFKENGITCVEDIPSTDRVELEKINDHETFWQNANRYLWDLEWERAYLED